MRVVGHLYTIWRLLGFDVGRGLVRMREYIYAYRRCLALGGEVLITAL